MGSSQYPEPVRRYLLKRYGTATLIEPLSGQSRSNVWRVHFRSRSVIVKAKAHPHEVAFYKVAAPWLRLQGLPIPNMEWCWTSDDISWLIIEDVSQPLPCTRWRADSEILKVLGRLHQLPLNKQLKRSLLFRPRWTATMTRKALTYLPSDHAIWMLPRLELLRHKYEHLFLPDCYISGDPNPTNWGISEDGKLMLYDWERFGLGKPALDLAITIAGLGNMTTFREVAASYNKINAHSAVESLARDIATAKVWSLIEFLNHLKDGKLREADFIHEVIDTFPRWLMRLDKFISS